MQAYSDPKRANNPYALPDVEVFQLTATEVASQDEDLVYTNANEGRYFIEE